MHFFKRFNITVIYYYYFIIDIYILFFFFNETTFWTFCTARRKLKNSFLTHISEILSTDKGLKAIVTNGCKYPEPGDLQPTVEHITLLLLVTDLEDGINKVSPMGSGSSTRIEIFTWLIWWIIIYATCYGDLIYHWRSSSQKFLESQN